VVYSWFSESERTRTLTPGKKKKLLLLAHGKCEYCGKELTKKGIREEIHHIKQFAKGGSDKESNLIVLCPDCHSRVDTISAESLKKKISKRLNGNKTKATSSSIKKAKVKRTISKSSKVKPLKTKSVMKATTKTRKKKTSIKKPKNGSYFTLGDLL
jgi:hypothetical protein